MIYFPPTGAGSWKIILYLSFILSFPEVSYQWSWNQFFPSLPFLAQVLRLVIGLRAIGGFSVMPVPEVALKLAKTEFQVFYRLMLRIYGIAYATYKNHNVSIIFFPCREKRGTSKHFLFCTLSSCMSTRIVNWEDVIWTACQRTSSKTFTGTTRSDCILDQELTNRCCESDCLTWHTAPNISQEVVPSEGNCNLHFSVFLQDKKMLAGSPLVLRAVLKTCNSSPRLLSPGWVWS